MTLLSCWIGKLSRTINETKYVEPNCIPLDKEVCQCTHDLTESENKILSF
jgi:hypothetical protein